MRFNKNVNARINAFANIFACVSEVEIANAVVFALFNQASTKVLLNY